MIQKFWQLIWQQARIKQITPDRLWSLTPAQLLFYSQTISDNQTDQQSLQKLIQLYPNTPSGGQL